MMPYNVITGGRLAVTDDRRCGMAILMLHQFLGMQSGVPAASFHFGGQEILDDVTAGDRLGDAETLLQLAGVSLPGGGTPRTWSLRTSRVSWTR